MLTPRLKIVCPSLVRLKCSGHSSIVLWRVIDNSAENRRNTTSIACSVSRRNFWSVAARRRPEEQQQEDEATILRSMQQFLVDESSCIRRDFEPGTSKRDDLQSSTVVLEYFSSRVSPVSVQFLPYTSPRFHAVAAGERWQSLGETSMTDTKRLYSKKAKPPSESPLNDELSLKKLLHLDAEDVKPKSKEAEISTSSPLFFPRSRSRQSWEKHVNQGPSPSASDHFAGRRKEASVDREVHKSEQRSQSLSVLHSSAFDEKHSQRPNLVVDSSPVNQRSTPPSTPPAMDGRLSLSSLFGLDPATTSSDSARRDTSPAATKASLERHVSKPVAIRNAEPTETTQQRPISASLPRSGQNYQHARKPAEESDVSLASLFGIETTKVQSKTSNEAALSKSLARSTGRPGSATALGATKSGEERVERPSSTRQAQSKGGHKDAHQSSESGEISLSSLFGLEPASSSTVSDKLENKSVAGSGSKPRSTIRPSSVPDSHSQNPSPRPSSASLSTSSDGRKSYETPSTHNDASLSALFGIQPTGATPDNGTEGAPSMVAKVTTHQRGSQALPAAKKPVSTCPHVSKLGAEPSPKRVEAEQITLSSLFGVEPTKTSPAADGREASSKIAKGSERQRAAKSRPSAKATAEVPSQTPTVTRPAPSEPRQQPDVKPTQDGELSLARLLGVEPENKPTVRDGVQASKTALKSAAAYSDDADAATSAGRNIDGASQKRAHFHEPTSQHAVADARKTSKEGNVSVPRSSKFDSPKASLFGGLAEASSEIFGKSEHRAGSKPATQPSQKPMDDGYVSLTGLFGVEAKKRNFDAMQIARHATIPRRLQTGTPMIGEEVHFAWTLAKGQSVISPGKTGQSQTRNNARTSSHGQSWSSPGSSLLEGGNVLKRGHSLQEGAPLFFPPSKDRSTDPSKSARPSRRRSRSRGPQKKAE